MIAMYFRMRAWLWVSVCALVLNGAANAGEKKVEPTQVESLIEAATKEFARVQTYQIEYDRVEDDFVIRAGPPMVFAPGAPPKGKLEPPKLLEKGDPRALKSTGRVQLARDGANYLFAEERTDIKLLPKKGPVTYRISFSSFNGEAKKYHSNFFGDKALHGWTSNKSLLESSSQKLELLTEQIDSLLNNQLLVAKVFINNDAILAGKKGDWILKHAPDPDVPNEKRALVIRTTLEDPLIPNFNTYRQMHFDPTSLPMPYRISIYSNSFHTDTLIKWRAFTGKDGKNVWFPGEISRETYLDKQGGVRQTKPYHVQTITLDAAKCKINHPVAATDLNFDFPPGTVVTDNRNK